MTCLPYVSARRAAQTTLELNFGLFISLRLCLLLVAPIANINRHGSDTSVLIAWFVESHTAS